MEIQRYINEFSDQASHPPGGDPFMKACYTAIVTRANTDQKLQRFFRTLLTKKHFTPPHFVNLFFRALQYTQLFPARNIEYPYFFTTPEQWNIILDQALTDNRGIIEKLLLTKDTTTTIYQRYAGVKAILNALYPLKKLRVADFGCGGNYGLPGLSRNIEFQPIQDSTPYKEVSALISLPITVEVGIAVDKENPLDPLSRAWRTACSFYPQELNKMKENAELEKRLSNVQKVHFVQKDLLSEKVFDSHLPKHGFDAVILSTICYQLKVAQQKTIMNIAQQCLNTQGTLIIQDFARVKRSNPYELSFGVSWFGKPYAYRTFITNKMTKGEVKEILKWENGRCRGVKPGRDFNFIKGSYRMKYQSI